MQEKNQKKSPGRPKSESIKEDSIRFRVKPELKQQLTEVATAKGISLSSLITMWLIEKLNQESRPGALLLESGNEKK